MNGIEVDYNSHIDEYLIAIPFLTADKQEVHYLLYAFEEFKGPVPKDAFEL